MMSFKSIIENILPWSLIGIFALICYFSQTNKSVTVDEFSHFPSGIYNLITSDWRMDHESPPLIKCFPALTSVITKPVISIKPFGQRPNTWSFGYDFMYRNQKSYIHIFTYGRCAIIFLGCLGGWLLFNFSRRIFGYRGALISLFLYCFNPNMIAHSRLTTIDTGASFTILFSIYCFWKFLKGEGTLFSAAIAGIALGLAQLSKFTALLLYPVFILIFGIIIFQNVFIEANPVKYDRYWVWKQVGHFSLMIVVSVIIINAGYLFSGTFTPTGEFSFLSTPMKKIASFVWDALPLPLPYDYLMGFDSQLAISSGNNPFYASFLMGKHSLTGWWYYYIVAFIVKNPASLLAITLLTFWVWIRKEKIRPELETILCIWIPIAAFWLYFSFLTHIQIGIRFLLPLFPLLFLASGYLGRSSILRYKAAQVILGVLLISYGVSCVSIFPNYLAYFNFFAGGPQKGYCWLIDSNLDWGQDLPALKNYMRENKIEKINLGYFGRVHPGLYGIDYDVAKREVGPGIHAISANFLLRRPYYLLENKSLKLHYCDRNYFEAYNKLKPVASVGHSIYIFNIKNNSIR